MPYLHTGLPTCKCDKCERLRNDERRAEKESARVEEDSDDIALVQGDAVAQRKHTLADLYKKGRAKGLFQKLSQYQ